MCDGGDDEEKGSDRRQACNGQPGRSNEAHVLAVQLCDLVSLFGNHGRRERERA